MLDKATVAGAVALTVSIALTAVGVYQFVRDGRTDLLLLVSGGALGYIFPKQK